MGALVLLIALKQYLNTCASEMELTFKRNFVKSGRGLASTIFSGAKKLLGKIPIGSVVNTAIDALPVELHLPGGYQYCGPGTKLGQRLSRGDPGINKLDQACKEHDIAYSTYSDTANRKSADQILAEKAWERVKSGDSSFGEKAAALAVTTAMKAKTKFGGGCKCKKTANKSKQKKRGGNIGRKRKSSKKGRNSKKTMWTMVKSGKGLYLKPHKSV